jgi:hypothetical protein
MDIYPFQGFLRVFAQWHVISMGIGTNPIKMKTTLTPELESFGNKVIKRVETNKKRKNYTEQFLQFLSRETSSEKRTNIFGADPFK